MDQRSVKCHKFLKTQRTIVQKSNAVCDVCETCPTYAHGLLLDLLKELCLLPSFWILFNTSWHWKLLQHLYGFSDEKYTKNYLVIKRQSNLIIYQFYICKSAYSLKFTCNPKINAWSTFVVICGYANSGKKFESLMLLFPVEVEWEGSVLSRLSYRGNQRMEMEYSKSPSSGTI